MNKTFNIKDKWVHVGYYWKGFGLGFRIDKYNLSIDFLFFWISVEF